MSDHRHYGEETDALSYALSSFTQKVLYFAQLFSTAHKFLANKLSQPITIHSSPAILQSGIFSDSRYTLSHVSTVYTNHYENTEGTMGYTHLIW